MGPYAVVRQVQKRGDGAFVCRIHYFQAQLVGGDARVCDPDGLIHRVAWVPAAELSGLRLSHEDQRQILMSFSWLEPDQARALLEEAGFEVEALYGDFDRSPFTDGSPEQIWVARRPDG